MYYFLNTMININKSGIEHAQIKRMNLFNEYGIPNKIVTKNLVLNAVDILNASRIPLDNYLNMYDFFRNEPIKNRPYTLKDFKIPDGMSLVQKEKEYWLIYREKTIMILMTKSDKDLRIDNIRLLSKDGKLVKTTWYDMRGFAGVEEYFDKNNELSMKQILAPSGTPVCQIFYMTDKRDKTKPTLYKLINYNGNDREFHTENQLITFFLDELTLTDTQPVYVGDRATEYAYSLFNMSQQAFKILVLHSSHLADNDNPLFSELNNNFYYSINHLSSWNAIFASTEHQMKDFRCRYGHQSNTYVIPVGTVDTVKSIPFEDRIPNHVGLVARLSPEKQQLQAVEAIEKVHEQNKDIKLHLYGYANGDYGQKVKNYVKKHHLEEVVIFENYTDDIQNEYKKMQLQLLTSSVEGFAMAILEGQSQGIPQISYDIKYGPKDIITNDVDGYLVQKNDVNQLAEKILFFFNDMNKAKNMSQKAYENSHRYSKKKVFSSWQPVFLQIKNYYAKKEEM